MDWRVGGKHSHHNDICRSEESKLFLSGGPVLCVSKHTQGRFGVGDEGMGSHVSDRFCVIKFVR
jgi:hypothetical protein